MQVTFAVAPESLLRRKVRRSLHPFPISNRPELLSEPFRGLFGAFARDFWAVAP